MTEKREKREKTPRLKYSHRLGGWFCGGVEKEHKFHIGVQEYVDKYNGGEFQDTDKVSYWTERGTLDTIVVTESYREAPDDSEDRDVPMGMYELAHDNLLGTGIKPYLTSADTYLELSDHTTEISEDIDYFLENAGKWKTLGLLHRRGILLFGPPGTGKTMMIEHICEKYGDGSRIIFVPPTMTADMIAPLKGALGDAHTIFVFEELCSAVDSSRAISSLLSFLDGEESWDRCLVIATTNYPEELPRNVVDRPGRFDRVYRVGNPSRGVREAYLKHMLKDLKDVDTELLARRTDEMSIAYLKELVVNLAIYGKKADEVLDDFAKRRRMVEENFAKEKSIGFSNRQSVGFSFDDEE